MNETLLLYLFTRVNPVIAILVVVTFIGYGVALFTLMYGTIESEPKIFKFTKISSTIATISLVLFAAIPTQKDLAIIIGGSYVIEAAKSDKAKELSGLLYDAIKDQLKGKK